MITYIYGTVTITGSYSKGRLSRVNDGAGSTRFKYDHRGNVLIKRQTIGSSATADLVYAYDLADRVTGITYPSDRIVNYDRDGKGRVVTVRTRASASATEVTLASGITYEPFGSLLSATYGNGLSLAQSWGNMARLQSRRLYRTATSANVSLLTYDYDNDDNMTSISDGVDATKSVTYNYDAVDRLTRSVAAAGSARRLDLVYDVNGNRTRSETRAGPNSANPLATDSYATVAGTNRLDTITGASGTRAITYDARGNTVAETRPGGVSVSAGYDGHGRLTSYANSSAATFTNAYNGLDDRVQVTSGSDVRRFVYDASGRVLGEYGASASDVKAETIWLTPEVGEELTFGGDDGADGYAPLAVATAGGTLAWVHGSHLGVPIVYTDTSGNAVAPSGFTQAGFPGQMQTLPDLYYNRYRDYEPTTGRYIQADPIGLEGGTNIYAYAGNNPIRWTDPLGLGPEIVLCGLAGPLAPACAGVDLVGSGLVLVGAGCYEWWEHHHQSPSLEMAEHRKGKRPSTQGKHEAGDARRGQDYGGEKGDKRPPRRPPGGKTPKGGWPPKSGDSQ